MEEKVKKWVKSLEVEPHTDHIISELELQKEEALKCLAHDSIIEYIPEIYDEFKEIWGMQGSDKAEQWLENKEEEAINIINNI